MLPPPLYLVHYQIIDVHLSLHYWVDSYRCVTYSPPLVHMH